MVNKEKVCKDCGYLTVEKICPNCGSKILLDKFKGKVVIFDAKHSEIANILNIKNNGKYAIKYN